MNAMVDCLAYFGSTFLFLCFDLLAVIEIKSQNDKDPIDYIMTKEKNTLKYFELEGKLSRPDFQQRIMI